MSANYQHTIADEYTDRDKRLGCMTGIFQIFSRQNFVTGRGRKRLTPGESGNFGNEPKSRNFGNEPNITMQKATEKNLEGVKERARTSVESSRSSFSFSSCSSTFTSIDSNKLSKQSPDNRNIVKNSIQRETRDLSIKIKTKKEGKTRVLKHIDSPRPEQAFKPVSLLGPNENPRFSYDEREYREKWKSLGKVRELPRFSLDSKESLIKKAASEPRSKSLLEDQPLPSVVTKLMGLEAFPNPTDTNKSRPQENLDTISTRKFHENKHNQISKSSRLTPKNTLSPKSRNVNSSAKPKSPKFPTEPASWKQTNGNQEFQTLYPSVYSQMEKRLTEIEFNKSGKDLRALKQILEAMQKARESIDQDKRDESSIKRGNSPKKLEASSPIARSEKVLQRSKISGAKKEMIPRNNQFRKSSQEFHRPMEKKSSVATNRSKQTSVSPRLKQSHPITQISEAKTPRRGLKRHDTEIFSSSRKFKPKSQALRNRDDDQLSEISSEARCLIQQGDALSACSESNRSIALQNDEVTGSLDEFKQRFGTKSATVEQPSPVSVLDTIFYAEGSPSPVKKVSSAFTDQVNLSFDEAVFYPVDLVQEFDEKLTNLEHLNDRFREVDSHDEANADNTTVLHEITDPTFRYVAEILSASGLLKDLGPSSTFTQLNESRHLINPHLFQILEQAKIKIEVEEDDNRNTKIYRRLIFDTTNEILINILISSGFSDPWTSPNKIGLRSLVGKKILEKVYSGMNDLKTNFECSLPNEDDTIPLEISGVVLDIERLIFKDLITEIVSGKARLPIWLNRHRRQLFTN